MTIEEKAARYDKAIEIAKKINNEHQAQPFNVMTRVFPELKESEDEKIRKELLESFKYQQRESRTDKEWLNGIKLSEVVAWLEKQGEQKSTDKVEPKFKVGDWVVVSNKVCQLTKVVDMSYNTHQYWTSDGTWFGDATDVKLWTIQDAKDGDVLKEDSCTFIVKRMKTDGTAIIHCCLFDDGDFDSGSTLCFDVDSTYPATQEQDDEW